jgi:hypothetical protein
VGRTGERKRVRSRPPVEELVKGLDWQLSYNSPRRGLSTAPVPLAGYLVAAQSPLPTIPYTFDMVRKVVTSSGLNSSDARGLEDLHGNL